MLKSIQLGDSPPDIAILVADKNFNEAFVEEHYIQHLDIDRSKVVIFNLVYEKTGKAPVGRCIRPHLQNLHKVVDAMGIKTILCCDAPYFKTLAKVAKAESHLGYNCYAMEWVNTAEYSVFYVPNASILFRNPAAQAKIDLALDAVSRHINGEFGKFHEDFIHKSTYITDTKRAMEWFFDGSPLYDYKKLGCDIETTGLALGNEVLSIAFAWNEHEGIACDMTSPAVAKKVIEFLTDYQGTFVWHGGTFDVKHLIWNYWMGSSANYHGMLRGLHCLFAPGKYEDTKALSYLATNSSSGNSLGLKDQAFEFAGNYAIDEIDDLSNVPTEQVLEYNIRDAMATMYVYGKHRRTVRQNQESVYQDLFLPSLKTICQMEMVGLPLNMGTVLTTDTRLKTHQNNLYDRILSNPIVKELEWVLRRIQADKDNETLKTITRKPEDLENKLFFNPGSSKQLQSLLHVMLELPIRSKTDTGQPSTDAEAIEAHIAYLENQEDDQSHVVKLLQDIKSWSEVSKITSTFTAAFINKSVKRDGWHFLLGNFNLGGTKSGRLSSSNPNLQNIPSTGTEYAKDIKVCVQAPPYSQNKEPGFLFVGADYFSLEDRIGALLSRDPNKLAVYVDGYDGHSLRAASYFPERMPDIISELKQAHSTAQKVSVIDSIAERYPDLRQLSKGPTFALTYLGTWKTLVKNFGLSEQDAKQIEANYHELYKVADDWAKNEMYKAHQNGFAKLAFGLRLETPTLPKILWEDESSWPYEVYKEKKTATNALGQSYGLLNSHTGNLFMQRVWDSKYALDIFPCAHIHDAQYYMIRNNLDILEWVNTNLIECMEWNELPELQHDIVKLGSQLEIFYPDWSSPIALPVRATKQQIKEILDVYK